MGSLTQSTSVFIRRSILVLLNFVLPLFCISLVSGPRKAWEGLGKPNNRSASRLLPGYPVYRTSGWMRGMAPGLAQVSPHVAEGHRGAARPPLQGPGAHLQRRGSRPPLRGPGITCEDDQPEAPLGVAQHAAPQQHILVAQGELVLLPVEGSAELIQLVVGRFTDHFT